MNKFIGFITLLFSFSINAHANDALDAALASQTDEAKARYVHRHPKETLEFFGVTPGTRVLEALPGGGWYSKILLPYLGTEGELIGVDYSLALWPNFSFVTEEYLEKKKTWTDTWSTEAESWRDDASANVSAAVFGSIPQDMHGTVDTVLFIRALHNMTRFESKGGFLTEAVADAYAVLKPGGIMGVVQHHAREDRPDSWADGNAGYLKKEFVIQTMRKAGFDYLGESDINANPKDQAAEGDVVWRLPPSNRGNGDDPEVKAKIAAIGESNRMTLKFRKPS